MQRWWSFAVLLGLLVGQTPLHLSAAPAAAIPPTLRAFAGDTNQSGPSAEAVDAAHGLIYKAFAGSRRVLVLRGDDLSIVRQWELPPAPVTDRTNIRVALNPAGDRLAIMRSRPTIADVEIYDPNGASLSSFSFSYDGRPLGLVMGPARAFIIRQETTLLVPDLPDSELRSAPVASGTEAALSADGRTLVYPTLNSSNQTALVVLDTTTLATRVLPYADQPALGLKLALTGNLIYAGSCTAGIRRVNLDTGARQTLYDGCVNDLAVSPDARTVLAAVPLNAALLVIDAASAQVTRTIALDGEAAMLLPLWSRNLAMINVSYSISGGYSGVVDLASGNIARTPYAASFTDGRYAFSRQATGLFSYDPAANTWRAAVFGGAVTRLLADADGTVFAAIGGAVARIPAGADRPDAFYLGGQALLLAGGTLYTHDGLNIFAADLKQPVSRALVVNSDHRWTSDMAFDAQAGKLILTWQRYPRNVLPEAGVAVYDVRAGAGADLYSKQSPSISMAYAPRLQRIYAATNSFANGQVSNAGDLVAVTLDGGRTSVPVTGLSLASARLAFDDNNGLLAVANGARLTALDPNHARRWTLDLPASVLDVMSGFWVVGGNGSLALVDSSTGRVLQRTEIPYALAAVRTVNTIQYAFDATSGALINAFPDLSGYIARLQAAPLPATSFAGAGRTVFLGDAAGQITTIAASPPGTGVGFTFGDLWRRADSPVASGAAQRSWTWGPVAWATQTEPYAEAPGGRRIVEYRDKTRMELTRPFDNNTSPWYVTNGLLVREMVTGQAQLGDTTFASLPCPYDIYRTGCPSITPIAGDPANNDIAPSYADAQFLPLTALQATGQRTGATFARDPVSRNFVVGRRDELATAETTLVQYDPVARHNIPQIFWNYMSQRGSVLENGRLRDDQVVDPLYAFGRPIIEPYWIKARVAGVERDVLMQLFERRVLTYTPANPDRYKVEMGNAGQHYYLWRYGVKRW